MAYLRPSHACALGAILIATVIAPSAANAASPSIQGVPTDPAVDSTSWVTLPADITNSDAPVDVFIQTVGDGALAVQQQEKGHGAELRVASEKASDVATRNEEVADAVATDVTNRDEDATVLYTSAYSVPGVAVTADPDTLAAIAGRADVVKISRIVSRTLDLPDGTVEPQNSASDAFTRAVDAWQQTGRTGQDVTVAVIDTGIDYTHATFGGPGTEDAYRTALASTSTPDPAWYDASKYLGGWDFAGTTYNGTSGTLAYDPVPRPDANPIDGPGGNHGTHVTGTAVGFGVTPDGQTFRGDYGSLASENLTQEFSVGPGTAPRAGVLGLKVFGDGGGATSLTGAALEWIAKEIADGRKIDVVNMSLGTDGGAVDDPDNAKVNALLDAGVLPVIAAGNAGDVTDISGSPGNTERALTVAASATGHGLGDTVYAWNGDPAASPPRTLLAQYSQNFYGDFSVQARVARTSAENPTGCAPFSAQDAAIAQGKIVWLAWDERNMGCGTAVRFDNAAAAGAVGVLLESQGDSFEAGIAGNSEIPGAQLSASAVAALIPALDDGTLIVGLRSDGKNSRDYFDAKKSDTPASFTSRGTHGSIDDSLKPDVSAPGVSIVSAANGTGTGRAALSGTSMASPHVAGIAALVTEAHPDWSPDRIKQQIMNTAVHDVTTGGAEPVAYGPARVGDGRVDALAAVQTTAGIASVENGGLVSASFGVVEVGEDPVEQTRTIRLSNDEDSAREMSLAYLPRTETPGVAFSLSQATVTIPARGSVEVTLTMSIADPSALRRTLDPTMDSSQGGAPRQYLADASGVLQATGSDGRAPIRMAVHVAPKPVSSTNVEGVVFDGNAGTLTNAGRGLDQGEGTQRYQSLMVPLVLGTEDPDDTFPETSAHETLESMDLREVGASSTAPLMEDPSQGVLTVGIVMDGEWATMSPLAYPMVQLDVNGDTRSDFAIILQRGAANTDLPMAITFDTVTGRTVDQRPVNGFFGDHGTNVFDNNVVSLSTSLAALGYTPGTTATTIRYIVQTRSYYAPGYDETYKGTLVDQSASVAFDVYHPPLTFGDEPTSVFTDQPGDLPVHRDAPTDARVLVLNLLAGHGNRSQIVTPASDGVTPGDGDPTPTPPSVSPPPVADPGGPTGAGDPQASPHLAVTGVDGSTTLLAVALASAALVTGFVLLLVRRRRTRRRHG